jgi:hypothetical protein
MRASDLFVCNNFRQVLQYPVRGYGKDAGHRLFVWTHWLQGQNVLNRYKFTIQFAGAVTLIFAGLSEPNA